MTNPYYVRTGSPLTGSSGSSAVVRGEFLDIEEGFDKLPTLTSNGSKAVIVNSGGTALTVTTGTLALGGNLSTAAAFTTSGAFGITLTATATTALTLPTTGTLATLAGAESLSNKTLVTPLLGTPTSGVLTNCTGYDASNLAGTTLAATVVASSLTSVGTLTSITVSGAATVGTAALVGTGLTVTSLAASPVVVYRAAATVNVSIEFRNDTASWFAGQGSTGSFNIDTDASISSGPKLTVTTAGNLSVAGAVLTTASATGGAGLRIPPGTAPSSPADGDVWTTNAGMFVRVNGVTVGPLS